jgi:hypothetical protein
MDNPGCTVGAAAMSALTKAQAVGLIRPAYQSMRDVHRSKLYKLEDDFVFRQHARPIKEQDLTNLIAWVCKRYRILKPEVRYNSRTRRIYWTARASVMKGIEIRRAGMDDATVLHECAHYIVGVHFGKVHFKKGEGFEPAHGPWFASVAFDLYTRCLLLDLKAAESRGAGLFAVSPTECNIPELIKKQGDIWSRFFLPPGAYTTIDPSEMIVEE